MQVSFTPAFSRRLLKLPKPLREEAIEKIELFKYPEHHKSLAVHKLHGRFKGCLSFSVNYKYRIVFQYLSKSEAVLLTIGDHEVYN